MKVWVEGGELLMSDQSVLVELPQELYERIKAAAQLSARPINAIVIESLDALFHAPPEGESIESVLEAMPGYTDAELWVVVYRGLTWSQSLRLRELGEKAKQTELTHQEETELQHLLDLTDQMMLLRSEALLLLQKRGQDMTAYLNQGFE
jgi:hypothetical protein